jgi:hypothetical protein
MLHDIAFRTMEQNTHAKQSFCTRILMLVRSTRSDPIQNAENMLI